MRFPTFSQILNPLDYGQGLWDGPINSCYPPLIPATSLVLVIPANLQNVGLFSISTLPLFIA